jgi:hypothetical protein
MVDPLGLFGWDDISQGIADFAGGVLNGITLGHGDQVLDFVGQYNGGMTSSSKVNHDTVLYKGGAAVGVGIDVYGVVELGLAAASRGGGAVLDFMDNPWTPGAVRTAIGWLGLTTAAAPPLLTSYFLLAWAFGADQCYADKGLKESLDSGGVPIPNSDGPAPPVAGNNSGPWVPPLVPGGPVPQYPGPIRGPQVP